MLTFLRAGAWACGGRGGALLSPSERDAAATAPASADLLQSSSEGHVLSGSDQVQCGHRGQVTSAQHRTLVGSLLRSARQPCQISELSFCSNPPWPPSRLSTLRPRPMVPPISASSPLYLTQVFPLRRGRGPVPDIWTLASHCLAILLSCWTETISEY